MKSTMELYPELYTAYIDDMNRNNVACPEYNVVNESACWMRVNDEMNVSELDEWMAAVEAELALAEDDEGQVSEAIIEASYVKGKKVEEYETHKDAVTEDAEAYLKENNYNLNETDPLNIITKGHTNVTFYTLSGEPLSVKIDPTWLEPFRQRVSGGSLVIRYTVLQQMVTAEYKRVVPPDTTSENWFGFDLDADQARFLDDGVEITHESEAFKALTEMILDGDESGIKARFPFIQVMYRMHRYVPGPEEYARISQANAEWGQRMSVGMTMNNGSYGGR